MHSNMPFPIYFPAGTTETTLQTHLLQANLLVIHRLSLGVGGCRLGIYQMCIHTVFDAEQHGYSWPICYKCRILQTCFLQTGFCDEAREGIADSVACIGGWRGAAQDLEVEARMASALVLWELSGAGDAGAVCAPAWRERAGRGVACG